MRAYPFVPYTSVSASIPSLCGCHQPDSTTLFVRLDQPIRMIPSSSTLYVPYRVPTAAQTRSGRGSPSTKRAVSTACTPMSTSAPPPASAGSTNQPFGPQPAWTPYPRVLTISPNAPAAIRSRIAITSGWNRQQWATISEALPRREASIIASHSATETAIGFSTSTCLPVPRRAIDCSAWSALGVAMMTAWIASPSMSARQSVVTRGIAYRSASVRALSSRWFAIATSSAPRYASTPRAWKSWIQPDPISATRTGSAFHTGQRDAFDECLLSEQEQHDHRQHEHDRGGHLLVPQDPTMDRGELLQPYRERPDLVVVERVDQWTEEVVPCVEELEESDGRDRGLRDFHDHVPHDLELVRAVDPGGVHELAGDRQEELAQQEDRERVTEERGHDQRLEGSDPSDLLEKEEQRHDRDLTRQHHRRDHQQEHRALSSPSDDGQRVRDRHRGEDDADRSQARVDERVPAVPEERLLFEDVDVVPPLEGVRYQIVRERLLLGHQRGGHDEEERQDEGSGQRDRQRVI